MTLAELLAQAGIKEEVSKGLPSEVVSAIEGYVAAGDKARTDAAELKRLSELERAEIDDYVTKYGNNLDELASARASLAAHEAALSKLKEQGIDVSIASPSGGGAKPVVPGSPAVGGNVDVKEIYGRTGSFTIQAVDITNEYARLYGAPLPDSFETLALEAQEHRMSPKEWAAKKFDFAKKRDDVKAADEKKKLDTYANQKVEEAKREWAERTGSNPNLVAGGPSRNSIVKKINPDEFHKSDGNISQRERRTRMLTNIHRDVSAGKTA